MNYQFTVREERADGGLGTVYPLPIDKPATLPNFFRALKRAEDKYRQQCHCQLATCDLTFAIYDGAGVHVIDIVRRGINSEALAA